MIHIPHEERPEFGHPAPVDPADKIYVLAEVAKRAVVLQLQELRQGKEVLDELKRSGDLTEDGHSQLVTLIGDSTYRFVEMLVGAIAEEKIGAEVVDNELHLL